MADENLINKIMLEYEELRMKAANDRKKRIADVNSRFPRIREIDKEIYRRGFENMSNIMKNPEKKDEYNKEFKEKLTQLEKEKSVILQANHIDPDYDKYKYKCKICSDTGYDENGDKCVCFKQKMINYAYSVSNMAEMIKKQNFESFSLDYYPKEKNTDGVSPYDNMVRIYDKCRSFCDDFDSDETKNLMFYGEPGLGKTFLSSAIAKEIMDNGKTVVYVRATTLFMVYRDYSFGKSVDENVIKNIYNSDLLIIDDLGAEAENEYNSSFLFELLNERIVSGRKMIINTNLSLNSLMKRYSMRFTSRLYENFTVCRFYGEDVRLQKLKAK